MYSAASLVADYTPGLLDQDGNFTATTRPTKAAVERWLSSGCSLIHTRLSAAGYTVPIPVTSPAYSQVVELETLYGVSRAEMVRMTSRVAVTERTRSQQFATLFNKGLDDLLKLDLSEVGVGHDTSQFYSGGISVSDKTTDEDDSDRVQPRFRRDQFRYPGTNRPAAAGGDGVTD